MADKIEKIIADTFLQMAEGLETGSFGKKPRECHGSRKDGSKRWN